MPSGMFGDFDGHLIGTGANVASFLTQGMEKLQVDRIGYFDIVGERIELVCNPFIKGSNLELRPLHLLIPQLHLHDSTGLLLRDKM
jgi:hypothetical protein